MKQIIITGNVTRDAEIRTTQGGDSVCSFSVAVNDFRTKEAYYFDCSYWGKRGSGVQPYLIKGTTVSIIGEFSWREHNEKKYLECNVSALDLLGKKSQSQNSETEEYNQAPMSSELNDEIPF